MQSQFPLHTVYLIAIALAALFFLERERKLKEKYKELAHYDELTGCVNFRWIMELLESETLRCKRYRKEMSVIMLDIDNFKSINDRHGHSAGNLVLRVFAEVVRKNVRNVDLVGRYGGEEFLILLPEADREEALIVLKRVQEKVREIPLPILVADNGLNPNISFSAGIASFPSNGETFQELVRVADRALYQAKNEGRDKIIAERRGSMRVKPAPGVKAEIINLAAAENLPVVEILNISKTGMMVAVPKNIEGKGFLCRIKLPYREGSAEVKCDVVHNRQSGKDLYWVGFSFIAAPKEFEREMVTLIKQSIFPPK